MRFTAVLTVLGLTALASSAPTDTPITDSTAIWQNTPIQKYYCKGKDIIRCQTMTEDSCIVMGFCDARCSLHGNGVICVDMSAPPTPKVPVSAFESKIASRNASPQENKHGECSEDRTGVLICAYGFCSTDHYCKAGDECKDGSFSCAPKSLSTPHVKSKARSVPPQDESTTVNLGEKPSYVCSKDRASVLKCLYGFCSIDYYCAKGHPCVDNPARCKKAKTLNSQIE